MSSVDQLFAAYVEEHRAGGEADPSRFVARASPSERMELAALIDGYLARAPRQAFDATEFRGSAAERTVDALERVLGGQSGRWPALLPQLRHQAQLKRSQVVERLAAALGLSGRETKVADYYNQMEQGTLPSSGVASRVLAALAGVLGESAESLREAGRSTPQPSGGRSQVSAAFARLAISAEAAAGISPMVVTPSPDEWDEVDELFRGGG